MTRSSHKKLISTYKLLKIDKKNDKYVSANLYIKYIKLIRMISTYNISTQNH